MEQGSVRGRLDSLLLAVIDDGPRHGYAVIEALRDRSGGELDLPTGTVYPALRRLESAGWLAGDWQDLGGRRRRVYALTTAGRHALAEQRQEWDRFRRTIGAVLGGPA